MRYVPASKFADATFSPCDQVCSKVPSGWKAHVCSIRPRSIQKRPEKPGGCSAGGGPAMASWDGAGGGSGTFKSVRGASSGSAAVGGAAGA